MIFRLSQKLATKIKAGRLMALPLDENPFTDWTAHLFPVGRTPYILLANTASLYSTVTLGKGITTARDFIDHALCGIRDLMETAGCGFIYEKHIAPACDTACFAKALDRSVTGSMNDMAKHAAFYLAERNVPPSEIGPSLSEVPMSALKSNGSTYGFPRDVFKAMVDKAITPDVSAQLSMSYPSQRIFPSRSIDPKSKAG
jgi:hypothetical protein